MIALQSLAVLQTRRRSITLWDQNAEFTHSPAKKERERNKTPKDLCQANAARYPAVSALRNDALSLATK